MLNANIPQQNTTTWTSTKSIRPTIPALGDDDRKYFLARLIQAFAPGISTGLLRWLP